MTCRVFSLGAVFCFIGATASAQTSRDLLRHVAENYQNLHSFEFAGHLTTTIPGTPSLARFGTVNAKADAQLVPTRSSLQKYSEGIRFSAGGKISEAYRSAALVMPAHLADYENIDTGVKYARELSPEALKLDGNPVLCVVLDVLYDRPGWQPPERSVKYWIDPSRLIVLQQQVTTLQDPDDTSIVWKWTYTIDSLKLNQPPPEWLTADAASRTAQADRAITNWIGKEAPNFTLPDLDGGRFDLSRLRGKVVLLDFWATWCAPCVAEIPVLEKLANNYQEKNLEIWGVSAEKSGHVKAWMLQQHHQLRTVIDRSGHISAQYGSPGLPSLVLINREGKIASYFVGTQSEESLRTAINLALNN